MQRKIKQFGALYPYSFHADNISVSHDLISSEEPPFLHMFQFTMSTFCSRLHTALPLPTSKNEPMLIFTAVSETTQRK